jgi:hypothetical protein
MIDDGLQRPGREDAQRDFSQREHGKNIYVRTVRAEVT